MFDFRAQTVTPPPQVSVISQQPTGGAQPTQRRVPQTKTKTKPKPTPKPPTEVEGVKGQVQDVFTVTDHPSPTAVSRQELKTHHAKLYGRKDSTGRVRKTWATLL